MNTPTTFSQSLSSHRHHSLLLGLLFLLLSAIGMAADLTFTPNAPIVEQGKQITLSVSGTSGEVTWTVAKGQIQGTGTQVTYMAPAQVGLDVVTVMDGGGNVATVKIVITLPNNVSLENAQWEVFTNRSEIRALAVSGDGKTLWVGTNGGLEKWDTTTSILQHIFLRNTDGLPSNRITALLYDKSDGLWIGTEEGLAYLNGGGELENWNKKDSEWPRNWVTVLLNDEQSGLWIGTKGSLVHRDGQGQWKVYDMFSESTKITSLIGDGQGGLWIFYMGEYEEEDTDYSSLSYYVYVAHLTDQYQWEEVGYFTDILEWKGNDEWKGNLEVPEIHGDVEISQGSKPWVDDSGSIHLGSQNDSKVFTRGNLGLLSTSFDILFFDILFSDGQGGLWAKTYGGVLHVDRQGKQIIYPEEGIDGTDGILTDKMGGLWLKTTGGLVHLNNQGERKVYNKENSKLPDNEITTLLSDGQSGLWIGTKKGEFAHLSGQDEWSISKLPNGKDKIFHEDGKGGLWIGTQTKGLIHLSSQGESTVYSKNLGLPFNQIDAICNDGQGGVWVGNYYTNFNEYGEREGNVSLAHLSSQGQWTTYEKKGLVLIYEFEYNGPSIQELINDGSGGVWIITDDSYWYGISDISMSSLIHVNGQGQWKVYKELDNSAFHLTFTDEKGDLWLGMSVRDDSGMSGFFVTGMGLAHLNSQDQLKIYTKKDSELPDNYISKFLSDGQGGFWMVTMGDYYLYYGIGDVTGTGLAHLSGQGQWTVYTKESTLLPSNNIASILNDGQGGLWIWVDDVGELAHLTFTQKTALCQTTDATTCENLQANKRAAILIAGGGADSSNTLWDTTEAITSYLYKVFNKRGFDNDEIYYLSPKAWADFNGDGLDDRIVDAPKPERPLTPEDVRLALEWSKGLGKLDQPLYLFFVDHGGTEKFQLSKLEYLEVTTLKTWLDDYQTVTGNQVMMVIDACHSGQLLESLKAPNRAIISSTSDGLAYFDRTDKRGFSRFFAAGLLKGMNFWEAFGYAGGEQTKLLGDMSKLATASSGSGSEIGQVPRFDDGSDEGKWLKQIYLNGSFAAGDLTLAVESLTTSTTLAAGTSLPLKAKAVLAAGLIKRVWAVIRPPKMNLVMDSNGTPILAVLPRLTLATSSSEKDVWETTWQEAIYNGNYQVTFYAEDNQGNIASSDLPVVITVTGGIDPPNTAQVQIHLEKDRYQRGEAFKATLTEELGWGYDLYAAVLFPDGQNFMTLKNTNELRPMNEAKPWYAPRKPHSPLTLFELTLPADLPTGKYCLFGILSPEQNEVFETLGKGLWVMDSKCFEIVP